MGRQDVATERDSAAIRTFTKAILHDLKALEEMLARGMIESGIRRFGAEQEFFLVDKGWRPATVAVDVLKRLPEGPFTTELALFNLEANLEPKLLTGRCFSSLQVELEELIETVRAAAKEEGAEVALTGILPTLAKSDLSLDNMTPMPRYYALNDALNRMRGGAYRLRIEGTDEILIEHDSVMLEACNTSCQVHLQVSSDEFPLFYNVAQVVTAPALAASVNSPLLFGKRLWYETRIALFQQSMDTRSATPHLREMSPRVRFGEKWVKSSVTELFQEDIARFRVLLAGDVDEDPFAVLESGGVPAAQGPADPQRDGIPLEPAVLRRHRGQPPPAYRMSSTPFGSDHAGRDRQRRVLDRVGHRWSQRVRRRLTDHGLRRREGQLPGSEPPRLGSWIPLDHR